MPLPLTIEDLTPRWLSDALAQRHPGVAVLAAEPFGTLEGTGTKHFLRVTYNAAGVAAGLPTQLCVKAGFSAHREAMLFLYQLEARFFAEIAPQLDIRVPRCLHAAADEGQGIVILEDLNQTGADFCRVQRTLTRDQATAFLDALAALHARWWNSPDLDDPAKLGWLVRHDPLPDDDWGAFGRQQLEPATWAHYAALPRAVALPNACRNRETMHAALQALRRFDPTGPARPQPVCLIHADPHLGNWFIDGDGGPGLLDWQSPRRGHWAHDVTYMLVSALDPLDRRAWEHDLIRHYLTALARNCVATPPEEAEAWTAIRAHICYGLFYWMVNPVEWQIEVNNVAIAPRFAWAAVDHDAPPIGQPIAPLSRTG